MTDMTSQTSQQGPGSLNLGKVTPAASVIGVIGLAVLLFGMFSGKEAARVQMMGSYLFGFIFWIGVTLGFFAIALLHYTVRGRWSVALIRILEAGGGLPAFIAMFAIFVPILVSLPTLYSWADPVKVAASDVLKHKAPYLNPTFFYIRLAVYLFLWGGLAYHMRRSSLKQESTQNFKLEAGRSSWCAPGILMFFITCTYAFTDWVMSLEPTWYSTMYGFWTCIAIALGGLSLSTLIYCLNANKYPFNTVWRPDLGRDLGNMLFTVTMLWGYTSLSQFLIIWNGNLPDTGSYYHNRGSNIEPMTANFTWGYVGLFCIIGQFFIPFFLLITPRMKKTPMNLAKVCAWVFIAHIVDIYQYVIPALPGRGGQGPISPAMLTDLLAFVAIGAVWVAVFGSQIKRAPLLPSYDTRLQEAAQDAH